jgi:hypothetical protein
MRTAILCLVIIVSCNLSLQAGTYVFKSGKSIQGKLRFEDEKTIRILESTGLEMTLRKSELNLQATLAANQKTETEQEFQNAMPASLPAPAEIKRTSKVYTNRDLRANAPTFSLPEASTNQEWQNSIARLERDFMRLQGACRAAGTGPNLSKILRSHTYTVQGKKVKVTGYWADPATIEEAILICARAIQSEEQLEQARLGYRNYLNTTQSRKGAK